MTDQLHFVTIRALDALQERGEGVPAGVRRELMPKHATGHRDERIVDPDLLERGIKRLLREILQAPRLSVRLCEQEAACGCVEESLDMLALVPA